MKKWIRRFLEKFGWMPRTEVVAILSAEYPDLASLPPGLLHIVGGKHYQKWAYLKCPCNCGAEIMLSLSAARRPRWRVKLDWLHRPTIEPSIWQTEGCFSHFWIRKGSVDWVKDSGSPPYSHLSH